MVWTAFGRTRATGDGLPGHGPERRAGCSADQAAGHRRPGDPATSRPNRIPLRWQPRSAVRHVHAPIRSLRGLAAAMATASADIDPVQPLPRSGSANAGKPAARGVCLCLCQLGSARSHRCRRGGWVQRFPHGLNPDCSPYRSGPPPGPPGAGARHLLSIHRRMGQGA